MTTIYLLRHGTRVSRNEDTLLSDLGVEQAQLSGKYFQDKKIDAIYASPLVRTQQTAQIISTELYFPVVTDDRLRERMEYDQEGTLSFEEFLSEWNKTTADRNYQPLYGGSSVAAGKRFKNFLDELPHDSTNVIVSHGGVIGDVLLNTFDQALFTFQTNPEKTLRWVEILECSITELQKEDGSYFLKRVNDITHLSSSRLVELKKRMS